MVTAVARLPEVKYQFCVGQMSRDLSHLSWWQGIVFKWLWLPFARFCHTHLNLPTTTILETQRCPHCQGVFRPEEAGTRLELQAICTERSVAQAIVATIGPSGFVHRLPVDRSLPTVNCKLDGVRFPLSDASKAYERGGNRQQIVVCPTTGELCRPHDSIKRSDLVKVLNQAERNTSKLTVAL